MAISLPDHPWSLHVYCNLIDALIASGRRLGWFSEPADESTILLRHDVDLDLDLALSHARAVAERRHFATYYFLLRGTTYNLLDDHGRDVVTVVRSLGHRVGLHVDASLYAAEQLEAGIATEIATFENLIGLEIDSLSFHRPATNPIDYDALQIDRPHSYEGRFFSDMAYVSDSKGRWNAPGIPDAGALQLLTHPVWWVGDHPSSARRFAALLTRRESSFATAARGYLSNFDDLTGKIRLTE